MLIRPMREEDIPHVAAIIGENYQEEWERRATPELAAMFRNEAFRPTYFVCEDEGAIIAAAGFMQAPSDYNLYEIFWVNVVPSRQRSGVGQQLIWEVIDEIRKDEDACLIQLTANIPRYYAVKFGFKTVTTFLRGTYSFMVLPIEDPCAVNEKHLKNFYDGDRSLWTAHQPERCRHCESEVLVRTIDVEDDLSLEDRIGACTGCKMNGSLGELIDLEIPY